jgi:hypothetical protein
VFLSVVFPLLTVGLGWFAAPARPHGWHVEGLAGEDDVRRSVAVTVASLSDGRGPSSVPTNLVGKRLQGARQLASAYPLTYALEADRHAGAIIGVDAEETSRKAGLFSVQAED